MRQHHYVTMLRWMGSNNTGTTSYTAYSRAFELSASGKAAIAGSSDPAFRGEASRWNPEELLVGALSACHQLWYLHLCAAAGLTVLAYEDRAEGVMEEEADGGGQFSQIILRPHVTLAAGGDLAKAEALHAAASRFCFIERTLNCRVTHEPTTGLDG